MKNFFKLIGLAKNYKPYILLNILFNLLATLFSLFSFGSVIPILNVLFSEGISVQETAPSNFDFSSDSLNQYINYYLGELIVEHGKVQTLVVICIFVVITISLRNLFTYLALFFASNFRNGIIYDIRKQLYAKITSLSLSYFSNERKGDLLSKMTNDVKEVEWSILRSIESVFRDPIKIIIFFFALFFMSTRLTLFVIIFLPVSGLIIALIGRSLRKSSKKAQKKAGVLLSITEETLSGIKVIQAFVAETFMRNKFEKENTTYRKNMTKVYRKSDLASPISEVLGIITVAVVLWYGGKLVFEGQIAPAFFITYLLFFWQATEPFKALTKATYDAQRGLASYDRIQSILQEPVEIVDSPNPIDKSNFESNINIQNISFAYENEKVIRNFNLTIPKGQIIALIGQSGSGKSTMANLIPRFYDVLDGEILIDNTNIKDIKLSDLRKMMGIVTQESILFNDTVHNNIAFGMESVKEEQVVQAAKIANAHEFISALENGYQTNIGDSGSKLSGGQRQRISIARAVLKNPEILILDEATSALDTESEKLVQDALNNLMKNRTAIVIAHRLSTIQHADLIVVMQNGEIIEQGKHQELLEKQGAYHKLIKMQSL